MSYHFPELNVNQILVSLSELCSLQVDEMAFKKPDPAQWQEIFRRMLCEITSNPEDAFLQPMVMLDFEYPELHNDSVPLMYIIVMMRKIMPTLGVIDFSGGDIVSPCANRLKKICSAVINFLRFKHSRLHVYEDVKAEMEQEREHLDTLLKRRTELRQKIDKIRGERAQQEPEIAKIQDEIEQVSIRMAEHQRAKQTKQKAITEIRTRISEKKAAVEQLKCSVLKTKDDADKLSSKIVQSPEKVRAEQENLHHQLKIMKDSLERKRCRLSQLQKLRESYKQYTQDGEKGLRLFESIQASINKETEIAEAMVQIHDKIQENNQQTCDLSSRKTHLQSMLTMRQEKLAKLSLQHQSRMKVLHEQLESLKEEKDGYIQKQSSDSERKLELIDYKKKMEDEVHKEHKLVDQRIKALMEMYAILLEKTELCHADIGSKWDEIRQLLKQ